MENTTWVMVDDAKKELKWHVGDLAVGSLL